MTVITKKENLKHELQKEYHSLKNFLKLDSIEEKPTIPIKENLYNSENSSYSQKDIRNYDNIRIKKDLKLEKIEHFAFFFCTRVRFSNFF